MKVGDKMFGFRYESIGVNAVWLEEMSEFIGKIGVVDKIKNGEVCLKFEEDDYTIYLWYPIPNETMEELITLLKRAAEMLQDPEMFEFAEEINKKLESL